jgi:ERCC4 domain/Ring finger domain
MVQLTIHVRPRDGYTYAGRIKTITVDSSCRLEQVIADLKLDTKKGIAIFSQHGRHELALNTSLASNNVQSGHLLETCSCPLLASVLSVALEDLDMVQSLPEDDRTRERIEPLLDLNGGRWTLEPWPERWSHDSVKSRIVCLAWMKKVIQRQDRFANLIVPQCSNLMELYEFLQESVFGGEQQLNRRPHNSMSQIFKPSTSRDGKPSTVWQLLQIKLDKMNQVTIEPRARLAGTPDNPLSCPIEAFLATEKARHDILKGVTTPSVGTPGRRKAPPSGSQPPQRTRRRLALESPSGRLKDQEWKCSTCKTAESDSFCLTENCPFREEPSCFACFSANHPILHRDHEHIPFTDARAKAVLKRLHRQGKQDFYSPQYASGPFAILSTLYQQMQQGQHSLDESRLKELAQQTCRSNLYDHQARGRNAFACIEGLMNKDLVRMERLPGRIANQEGIYSLLPAGEALGKYCYTFEQAVNSALAEVPSKRANVTARHDNPITLIVDTREDQTYAKRLIRRCEVGRVPCQPKELPAGDYLFVVDGKVCPIVVERKSWSDLADSVLGKGEKQRRLDCVRLGHNQPQCENGRCQLCKMKASGCSKIMFVIEGARCENRDDAPDKCMAEKRCQYCKEIQQRHGREIIQERLEEVLFRLQTHHGCFIHYTRSYNETIDLLLSVRDILWEGLTPAVGTEDDDVSRAIALSLGRAAPNGERSDSFIVPLSLSYEQFCANARRKGEIRAMQTVKPSVVEWDDYVFIKRIFDGSIEAFVDEIATGNRSKQDGRASHVVDLNDSFTAAYKSADDDDTVMVLDSCPGMKSTVQECGNNEVVILDSDDESQGSVQVVEHLYRGMAQEAMPLTIEGEANDHNAGTSAPTLLLVNGLYRYDFEFYKDISALWKALYQNHKASDATVNGFEALCKTELRKLQDEASPLVHRSSVLFWLVDLQVRNGILVHVMRESKNKERLTGNPPLNAVAPLRRSKRTPRRDMAPTSPKTEPECIICTSALGKASIDVLPCMHCFHSQCLQTWLNSKSSQNCCPICKHDLGTYTGRSVKPLTRALESATTQRNRPPLLRSDTERERVRLARLSRFGAPALSHATPASVVKTPLPSNATSGWNCIQCTLLNASHAGQCEACSAGKPNEPWQCGSCTLLNGPETFECGACGVPNGGDADGPRDGAFIPEFERPAVFTRTPSHSDSVAYGDASTTQVESFVTGTKRSKVTCGACGRTGHNRATATAITCPKYGDQAEVERRTKKAAAKEREAQETVENIARITREGATRHREIAEATRLIASLEQAAAADARLRADEIKRLQKRKARAEKQAQKYR